MRKEYLDELEQLKLKMEKAEKFAEKLPVFADYILEHKFSGEEPWLNFGKSYKKMYLVWDIGRGFYRNGDPRRISNYPKDGEYCQHLFHIYINTLSLFDEHNEFGLYGYLKDVDVFFADKMNTTFYITDENIHAFLEALYKWYCDAIDMLKIHKLKKQESELKKKLEETQKQLNKNAA
jgi:hypothetical protein